MIHSLSQQSRKIAVLSASALSILIFASLPGYSQNLGTFRSGPIRTDREFNRSLQFLQGSGSNVICGNNVVRSRFRNSFRRRFFRDTLTNNPLIPNRLNSQQSSGRQITQTLTNDPLVPNRLNTQPFRTGASQVRRSASQSVTCQTITESDITTINQPFSNQSVNITINNGSRSARTMTTRTMASSRLVGDSIQPLSVASLPDGNYRVTSALDATDGLSDVELVSNGGRLFTFNKSGSTITGNFNDFDGASNACVIGSVDGNLVTGQVVTSNLGTNVLGRNYLDLGLTLELGEQVASDRYENSVLNLSGFSRINAGTTFPPTRC
ncbi:hypothetical protein S7335_4495 [Synechococcus sp. PCC 7335]|uniref:hypothetical protein n=1 Tax=Synechococcus sp. (strain ATCC 29403 / PCC 7335) TaxID=91464 RepID=UPI00017EDFDF|nr:hypothetical protein [Synechococcus sp. PCC 7335]EDX86789.1 hypothetical protein S7335_4495 [Synechococcus sp. PCC 7335]